MKNLISKPIFYYKNGKNPEKNKDYYKSLNSNFELWYFLDDKSEFLLNATTFYPKKNTLVIVKPSVYHKLLSSTSNFVFISFDQAVLTTNLIKDLTSICNFSVFYKDSSIADIFNNLLVLNEVMTNEDFSLLLSNTLQNLILQLKYTGNNDIDIKNVSPNPTLLTIIEYIDNNLESENLTINTISNALYISPSTISHIFAKYLQTTPQKYINNKKMIYAKTLIDSGLLAVQVAKKCGYANYVTFYRLYKQFFNNSPSKN